MKEEEMKEEEENKISDTCNLQKPTTRQEATRPTSKLPHQSQHTMCFMTYCQLRDERLFRRIHRAFFGSDLSSIQTMKRTTSTLCNTSNTTLCTYKK